LAVNLSRSYYTGFPDGGLVFNTFTDFGVELLEIWRDL
jgi:hypothetical protein